MIFTLVINFTNLQSWRLYFNGMDGNEQAADDLTFNQPTIVLSSGNLKNNSSAGLVSENKASSFNSSYSFFNNISSCHSTVG